MTIDTSRKTVVTAKNMRMRTSKTSAVDNRIARIAVDWSKDQNNTDNKNQRSPKTRSSSHGYIERRLNRTKNPAQTRAPLNPHTLYFTTLMPPRDLTRTPITRDGRLYSL